MPIKVQGHAELEIEKPRVNDMISPNYSILKPTVFVLTSIYAKVFEQR